MIMFIILALLIHSVLSQTCTNDIVLTLTKLYGTVSTASFSLSCCSAGACTAPISPFECVSGQDLNVCIKGYSGIYCSAFAGVLCEGPNTISQNCTGLAANYRDNSTSIGYDYLCCPDGVDCVKSNAYCGAGVGAAICIKEGYGGITCSGVSPSPYSYNVSRCIAMPITTITTTTTTPTTTPITNAPATGITAPDKTGIEIGVPIAAVALLCIVAYLVLRYKRMSRNLTKDNNESESNTIIMEHSHKPEERDFE